MCLVSAYILHSKMSHTRNQLIVNSLLYLEIIEKPQKKIRVNGSLIG